MPGQVFVESMMELKRVIIVFCMFLSVRSLVGGCVEDAVGKICREVEHGCVFFLQFPKPLAYAVIQTTVFLDKLGGKE